MASDYNILKDMSNFDAPVPWFEKRQKSTNMANQYLTQVTMIQFGWFELVMLSLIIGQQLL